MSGVQPPQALFDLYRDLRDRRLLPLVVVLVTAMAVVPIMLSSSPPAATPVAPVPGPVAKANAPAKPVVLTEPGVRDYRRRLSGPIDPFVQRFSSPPESISDALAGAEVVASAAGSAGATAPVDVTGAVAPANVGGSTVTTKVQTDTKVVFYRLKLKSGEVGGEMKIEDEVGPSATLPSKAVPALVFLGASFSGDLDAERAYFLVSNGVTAISGEAQCNLGDPCQLLSLRPGQYVDLTWSDGRVYRVTLLAFQRHVRDEVPGQFGVADGDAGQSG